MKKINKKITSFVLCASLATSAGVLLAGCGDNDDDKTIMNVSLNPSVEFILDDDDKVVSVNAKNEEGNLILSAQTSTEQFVGKDAEDAVKLFASYSKDMGFLVQGEIKSGDNEIKVQFSGDNKDAEKLYNDIKSELDEYLKSVDIQGTLTKLDNISKEAVQNLLAECEPYLSNEYIKNLSLDEMIEKIKQSRDETKEYLSQELKQAYYEAKQFAVEQAKFENLKSQLDDAQKLILDGANSAYKTVCDTLEDTRKSMFVNEDSPYQIALKAFREKKVEFLNYKNYIQEKDYGTDVDAKQNDLATLAKIESALEAVETQLENAKTSGNSAIDIAKVQVTNAYNAVVNFITGLGKDANELLDNAGKNITTNIETFETQFKADYSTFSQNAKQEWENMKTKLVDGYKENV